ncbi:MAG: site-specific DNA-methyltransferase [Promethearchaeota archaeon]|nr:MAG: site-specific DNA-methyltransferase [Candidatus Lokiarchaeota archaeon]
MEELEDRSVQLIITSPPYGKIKDYGAVEQIGYYDSFEEYFTRLKAVWEECYRVLEPQCRMIINIGDQYLRTTKFGRYRILSIASKIIEDCTEIGFDFLGDIIWQKISTTNTSGGCSLMGSIYYPRNGLLTYDYEHILIFKKYRGKKQKVALKTKELSKISLSEWKKWYVGHWKFPGIMQKEHIAMFPEELPYRLIRMFSFIGDNVLDPFLGSGTTLKVAKALFRKGIGYEINPEFKDIIQTKINEAEIGYFQDYQHLLYKLYSLCQKEQLKIKYSEQRQKGIVILENLHEKKLILDYLLLNHNEFAEDVIISELDSKIEENSVQYYLSEKESWKDYSDYVIVLNSTRTPEKDLCSLAQDYIDSLPLKKKIQFVSLQQIHSEQISLRTLFETEKN